MVIEKCFILKGVVEKLHIVEYKLKGFMFFAFQDFFHFYKDVVHY